MLCGIFSSVRPICIHLLGIGNTRRWWFGQKKKWMLERPVLCFSFFKFQSAKNKRQALSGLSWNTFLICCLWRAQTSRQIHHKEIIYACVMQPASLLFSCYLTRQVSLWGVVAGKRRVAHIHTLSLFFFFCSFLISLDFRPWSSSNRETSADRGECQPPPAPDCFWKPSKIWLTLLPRLVGGRCQIKYKIKWIVTKDVDPAHRIQV